MKHTETTQPAPVKRLFGTNGVRGRAGIDMTPDLTLRIGIALGSMRNGASDSEQLPGTTVVTPCSSAGKAYGSQNSCAS